MTFVPFVPHVTSTLKFCFFRWGNITFNLMVSKKTIVPHWKIEFLSVTHISLPPPTLPHQIKLINKKVFSCWKNWQSLYICVLIEIHLINLSYFSVTDFVAYLFSKIGDTICYALTRCSWNTGIIIGNGTIHCLFWLSLITMVYLFAKLDFFLQAKWYFW